MRYYMIIDQDKKKHILNSEIGNQSAIMTRKMDRNVD
jgi:hypothetical protein